MGADESQGPRKRNVERPPKSLALPAIVGVGERLRWIREKVFWGASQAEIGALLKVSGNQVKEMEYDRAVLDLPMAQAYARVSGVPLDWIVLGRRLPPADSYAIAEVRALLDRLEQSLVMEVGTVEYLPDPENEAADLRS
jgi:transcriptional regulator with XRE-family HTH domain